MGLEVDEFLDPINHQDMVRLYRLTCDVTGRQTAWCLSLEDALGQGYRQEGDRYIYEGPEELDFVIRGRDVFFKIVEEPQRVGEPVKVRVPTTVAEYKADWTRDGLGPVHMRGAMLFSRAVHRALGRYPCLVNEQDLDIVVSFRRRLPTEIQVDEMIEVEEKTVSPDLTDGMTRTRYELLCTEE